MEFVIKENPSEEDINAIIERLREYNRPFLENMEGQKHAVEAREEGGRLSGGIVFYIAGRWLHIGILWLSEESRGKGLGSKLLKKAEETGRAKGCENAYLSTFSFQAKPFYEKHGYRTVYVQRCYSGDVVKYHMEKEL